MTTSLRASADFYRANPFYAYDPMRGMLGFHRSPSARRLVRAGNQVGKSIAGAYEAWAHLVGRHRWRPGLSPSSGWAMVADLENVYPVVSAKLRSLEPAHLLDPATRYAEGKGYYTSGRRMVRTRAGHTLAFRSGEGAAIGVEAASIGWLWIDEPPSRAKFGGALSRVAVAEGPVWITCTPVGRPVEWFRRHLEGDLATGEAAREHWDTWVVPLSEASCTTESGRVIRSASSIARQVASYGAWEIRQRVHGDWEGVTEGRWIPAYGDACVVTDEDVPSTLEALGLGWDHGERPGAQACYLVGWDGHRLWVLGEYTSHERATPAEDAQGAWALCQRWGLSSPFDVAEARGDSNSAGKLGLGASVNDLLEREFARMFGLDSPPFRVRVPYKARGSVKARARMVSAACASGRFLVHESCRQLDAALRNWAGRDDDLKHALDACGYIAEVWLGGSRDAGQAARLTIS